MTFWQVVNGLVTLLTATLLLFSVILLSWFIWLCRKDLSGLLRARELRVMGIRIGLGSVGLDVQTRVQETALGGLVRSLRRALLDDAESDRRRVAEEDLPRLKDLVAMGYSSEPLVGEHREALRRLRQVCDELEDSSRWIPDYEFVSGRYGFGVWPSEMQTMARNGWIESSSDGSKVRVTQAGRMAARSSPG